MEMYFKNARNERRLFHRAIRSAGLHAKTQPLIHEFPPLDDACGLLAGMIGTRFPHDANDSLIVHMVKGGLQRSALLPKGSDDRPIAFLVGLVSRIDGLYKKTAVAACGDEETRWVPLLECWPAFEGRCDPKSIRFEDAPHEDVPILPGVAMVASRILDFNLAQEVVSRYSRGT